MIKSGAFYIIKARWGWAAVTFSLVLSLTWSVQAQEKKGIEDKTTQAEAHYELGLLYHEGMFEAIDRAITEYEQATQLKPDFADAHFHLALGYHTKGKLQGDDKVLYQKALTEYRLCLKYSPHGELAAKTKQNIKVLELKLKKVGGSPSPSKPRR